MNDRAKQNPHSLNTEKLSSHPRSHLPYSCTIILLYFPNITHTLFTSNDIWLDLTFLWKYYYYYYILLLSHTHIRKPISTYIFSLSLGRGKITIIIIIIISPKESKRWKEIGLPKCVMTFGTIIAISLSLSLSLSYKKSRI